MLCSLWWVWFTYIVASMTVCICFINSISLPRCSTTAPAGGKRVTLCLLCLLWSSLWLDWWFSPASKVYSWDVFPFIVNKMFHHWMQHGWLLPETLFFKCYYNHFIIYRIIHTTLVLSMEVFEPFVGYYFFNVLLMVLQALHIFWAGLILRMVYKFQKGKVRISSKTWN